MKPNLVPLSANRICIVCARSNFPRSEFVGERAERASLAWIAGWRNTAIERPQGPRETPITNATSRGHYTGAELRHFRVGQAPWMPSRCPAASGIGWFTGAEGEPNNDHPAPTSRPAARHR